MLLLQPTKMIFEKEYMSCGYSFEFAAHVITVEIHKYSVRRDIP